MKSSSTPSLRVPLVALALVALAGCGKPEEVLVPVQGQIHLDGKALTRGTVVLLPDATKNNKTPHEPRGSIDATGHYQIFTHPRAGAPPGWYKVGVIVTASSDPANPYAVPRSLIPAKFNQPDESGLRIEVRTDAPPGAYDLTLEAK